MLAAKDLDDICGAMALHVIDLAFCLHVLGVDASSGKARALE